MGQCSLQEGEYHVSKLESDVYPDFVMMAKSCGVPGRRVVRPADLREAVRYALQCQNTLGMMHAQPVLAVTMLISCVVRL